MRFKLMLKTAFAAMSLAMLAACSAGNPALKTAQMQSSLSNSEAQRAKFPSEKITPASAALDSSKSAEKIKDDELALVQAELSNLRYRVIFAEAVRDSAKAENAKVMAGLAEDEKRLEEHKKTLKAETKGGK